MSVKNQKENLNFIIPRNQKVKTPVFERIDTTNLANLTSKTINEILTFYLKLKRPDSSVHIHLKPENNQQSYLFVFKYKELPIINNRMKIYDFFQIFCPSGILLI